MNHARRQSLHVKVRRCLELAITACETIPHLPNFKRPPTKIPTTSLFSNLLEESDPELSDVGANGFPWGLDCRDLICMVWHSWPASSIRFSALTLEPKTSVFFEFNDSGENGLELLAIAEGISADLAGEIFMSELFRSNGETFHTGVLTSPPSEVTSIFSPSFLADRFLEIATYATEYYGAGFWEDLQTLIERSTGPEFESSEDTLGLSNLSTCRRIIEQYLASTIVADPFVPVCSKKT